MNDPERKRGFLHPIQRINILFIYPARRRDNVVTAGPNALQHDPFHFPWRSTGCPAGRVGQSVLSVPDRWNAAISPTFQHPIGGQAALSLAYLITGIGPGVPRSSVPEET